MNNTSIQAVPNPLFKTANSLNEAMSDIKAHLYPYDPNTVHSLVMMYHNTLLKAVCDEQQAKSKSGAGNNQH